MFLFTRSASNPSATSGPGYAAGMSVRAADVAAELRRQVPDLRVKKLHKLLYYCQGHHLAATGHALFTDTISAWDMGPVVGTLWRAEKDQLPAEPRTVLNESQLNTIGYVLSRYGKLTGRDLERLTHAETPWQRADLTRIPHQSSRIELEWLLDHFRHETDDEAELGFDSEVVSQWLADTINQDIGRATPDSYDALRARLADAG